MEKINQYSLQKKLIIICHICHLFYNLNKSDRYAKAKKKNQKQEGFFKTKTFIFLKRIKFIKKKYFIRNIVRHLVI